MTATWKLWNECQEERVHCSCNKKSDQHVKNTKMPAASSNDDDWTLVSSTRQLSLNNDIAENKSTETQSSVPDKILIILRGISGSGKSTLAKYLVETAGGSMQGAVYSTDDYFVNASTGMYTFDPSLLGQAHRWNQERSEQSMKAGLSPIVIDNTHTQKWEAKPYVSAARRYGYGVEIMEPETWWRRNPQELARRNTHGVSLEVIQRMLDRWEHDYTVENILVSEKPSFAPSANTRLHSGYGRTNRHARGMGPQRRWHGARNI